MNKDKFTELKHDTQTEIARLTEERMELRKQLEAAREEYDCLKVLQAQQMADYQDTISSERQVSGWQVSGCGGRGWASEWGEGKGYFPLFCLCCTCIPCL